MASFNEKARRDTNCRRVREANHQQETSMSGITSNSALMGKMNMMKFIVLLIFPDSPRKDNRNLT